MQVHFLVARERAGLDAPRAQRLDRVLEPEDHGRAVRRQRRLEADEECALPVRDRLDVELAVGIESGDREEPAALPVLRRREVHMAQDAKRAPLELQLQEQPAGRLHLPFLVLRVRCAKEERPIGAIADGLGIVDLADAQDRHGLVVERALAVHREHPGLVLLDLRSGVVTDDQITFEGRHPHDPRRLQSSVLLHQDGRNGDQDRRTLGRRSARELDPQRSRDAAAGPPVRPCSRSPTHHFHARHGSSFGKRWSWRRGNRHGILEHIERPC